MLQVRKLGAIQRRMIDEATRADGDRSTKIDVGLVYSGDDGRFHLTNGIHAKDLDDFMRQLREVFETSLAERYRGTPPDWTDDDDRIVDEILAEGIGDAS